MKYSGTLVYLATLLPLLLDGSAFVVSPARPASARRSNAKEAPRYLRRGLNTPGQQQRALHASNNWFTQFLTTPATKSGSEDAKVVELKQQLLKTLRPTERGVSTSDEQRQAIDALIAELEPFNPNAQAVTSESLSALWILQWTTEREILFLMEKGLLGLRSGPVQQAIDVDARTLSNTMLFGPDSFFDVSSSIDPEDSGPRVNFEFEACKLKYRGLTVPLPPVGKGWFESVYLDEDLRITRDVRGDVTVLLKSRD